MSQQVFLCYSAKGKNYKAVKKLIWMYFEPQLKNKFVKFVKRCYQNILASFRITFLPIVMPIPLIYVTNIKSDNF